jgi:hypothetical protein
LDRIQKEERVQRQDGKVFEIGNVAIEEERYRSPDYKFEAEDCHLSSTGHLKIFRLTPISGKPPSFTARWDGGSREPGKERFELDIDMEGMSNDEIRKFKGDKCGYSGHHTVSDAPDSHRYQILLKTPNAMIFDATVSFTLLRKLAL